MRKFTLLFAFLLSLIGVTQAQTVITDLGSLSNDKVYILSGDKGTLQVNDDATAIVRAADLTKAENQQFAILKSIAGTYHLYSVSAQKFVSRLELKPFTGFSDFLASAVTLVPHAPNGEASGKFVIKSGDALYNINGENNLVVNGWNTHDAGNGFQIEEVGDLGELSADLRNSLEISTSTTEQPTYYAIKNKRANNYASAELSSDSRMRLAALQPESFFYFTDASVAAEGTIPEGGKAVYIHNVATNKVLAGHAQNPWGDAGTIYYIVPAAKVNTSNTTGYVITKSLTDLGGGSSWNNFQGKGAQVDSWNADDDGSIWSFEYKTAADLVATIDAVLPEAKATAIAEADIEKNRAYYSVSKEAYNECVSAINSLTATNCSEYLAAKENMQTALAKLKVSERVNPLQGGEIVIIHNRKNAQRYITTDAAEETAEAEVSLVKGKATVDTRSLWTVVAVENGKFKLCNALSGKYIQHQGDNNLTLVNAENATAYAFINKENHWILIDAGDVGNRHVNIRDWQGAEGVAGWTDETDQGNHWEIIAPTAEQLARLEELQTDIATLKVEAVKQLENKIEAFKNENNALDFYNVSAEAITVCENAIKAEIQNVTTHAALEVIKNGMDAAIAQLWNSADNRVNPVTAGVKVKFRNKAVAENYMTVDADGATTSATVTSASIWTLVAGESDAYYLYNPLNNTYLKHATANGGQAAMVSDKAEASLYQVTPSGKHVLIGLAANDPYAAETDRDYVHCNDPEVYVTRYTEDSDRSLWAVTKVSDDDATALETEIQTILTERYSAAYAEVNNMVEGFRVLDFYRPEAAIAAYDKAVKNLTAPTTFDELDAAIATLLAAKTAFEAAVNEAVTNGTLSPVITNGVQVKLLNRGYSTRYMSSTDNKTVSAIEEQTSETIWQFVENDEKTGFYLFNPLMNLYVKHPTGGGTTAATLVADRAEASLYTVTPEDFLVKLAAEGYSGTEEYLNLNGWQGNFNVVRWEANGVANNAASYWALKNVTEAELTQLAADIKTEAAAQLEEYKDAKRALVEQYKALTNYGVAEAAVTAFETALAGITTEEYANLADKKAAVDAAFAMLEATRATTNPLVAEQRVTFKNVANPTLFMTATAAGVDAIEQNYLENYWTLKAATDGFYLYNEAAQKYVLHPAANGSQAKLVSTADSASVYSIEPTEMSVFLRAVTYKDTTDCLHYGGEHYVTRWNDDMDASKWGFEVVSDADFLKLAADTLVKYQTVALARANATLAAAYYGCTQDNVNTAVAAINAVQTEVASIDEYFAAKKAIDAALAALYATRSTAGPADGDKIRLRNKKYGTYLGFSADGVAHYATLETAADGSDSPESTVWQLVEAAPAADGTPQFYMQNVMIMSYVDHPYYDGDQVQTLAIKGDAHPEILEVVEVYAEDGQRCFVVKTTESTSNPANDAMFAETDGKVVNGNPADEASMWVIAKATEEDEAGMTNYQAGQFHEHVFAPVIEEAKRYYYVRVDVDETTGVSTEVVENDYIDAVRAGAYHYTGTEYATLEAFKTYYRQVLDAAIKLEAQGHEGTHDPSQAYTLVQILSANMASLQLNLPNRSGFFRLHCVCNDLHLQSDYCATKSDRLALTEEDGMASIFYFEAEDGEDGGGRFISYDKGRYISQGKLPNGSIFAKRNEIGEEGDAFKFHRPANKTFGSYNISSYSAQLRETRYLYGNAKSGENYFADNGGDATIATQGDQNNNNGYNWLMERVSELPLKINAFGYATFYAPIALKMPEGVNAYICTGVDEKGELSLTLLENGIIPAGTAVIIKSEEYANTTVYLTEPEANETQTTDVANNLLKGTVYETWRQRDCQNLKGADNYTYGANVNLPTPTETGKVYTLSRENGRIAMYRFVGNKFTHFRAFLDVPTAVSASFDALNFGSFEEPTAIERVPVEVLGNGEIYDLSGRRVLEPGKGVYIVNGKKVYIK